MRKTRRRLWPEPNHLQHFVNANIAVPAASDSMRPESLRNDVVDRHPGIERSDWVLEDDLHVAASPLQRAPTQPEEILAVKRDLPSRRLDQPQQCAAERGLPATGFADEPDRLPRHHVEVHPIHRPDLAGDPLEHTAPDREVLDHAASTQKGLDVAHSSGTPDPTPTESRTPSSQSQQAACWTPACKSGGSSRRQRSKA